MNSTYTQTTKASIKSIKGNKMDFSIEDRIQSIILDLDQKIKDQEGAHIRSDYRQMGVFKDTYIGFEKHEDRVVRFKFRKSAMNIDFIDVVFCSVDEDIQYNHSNQDTLFIMIANDMTDFDDIQWKSPVFKEGVLHDFKDTDEDFCIGFLKNEKPSKSLEKFINPVLDLGKKTNHILYVENEECFVSLTKGFKEIKGCYVKADVFAHYQPEIDFSLHSESGKQGSFSSFGFKVFYNDCRYHNQTKMVHDEACDYILKKESIPSESRCYSKQEHPRRNGDFIPKPKFPFIKRYIETNKGQMVYKDANPCFIPASNVVQHCNFGDNWRAVLTEKKCRAKKDNIPTGYNKVKIFSLTKGSYKEKAFYIVKFHSEDSGLNLSTGVIEPLTEAHILWCSKNAYWKIEQLLGAAKVDDIEKVLGKSIILIKMDNPNYEQRKSNPPDKYIYEYTSVEGRFIEEYNKKDQEEIDLINSLPDSKDLCFSMDSGSIIFQKGL